MMKIIIILAVSILAAPSTKAACPVAASKLGNGWCNAFAANTEECGWDGGDCCEASCKQNPDPVIASQCGSSGYSCKDPSMLNPTSVPTDAPTAAPTASPTAAPTASPTAAPTSAPSASPTAAPTASPTAAPTAAPSASPTAAPTASPTAAPTAAPSASPTADCNVNPSKLGNGWCNAFAANTEECGWDGGDCCEASCKQNPDPNIASKCGSSGYFCKDPSMLTPTSVPTSAPTSQCNVVASKLGNGWCNRFAANTKECGWDGGDCCEASCKQNPDPVIASQCGSSGYFCRDPSMLTPTSAPTSLCNVDASKLGNGWCNRFLANTEECGWDGGDCCEASCKQNPDPNIASQCGSSGYFCKDPSMLTPS